MSLLNSYHRRSKLSRFEPRAISIKGVFIQVKTAWSWKCNMITLRHLDINECDLGECEPNVEICQNTVGSFECSCAVGYSRLYPENRCTNINECESGDICVGDHKVCEDYDGGYLCYCERGYKFNTTTCSGGPSDIFFNSIKQLLNWNFFKQSTIYKLLHYIYGAKLAFYT